jgi:hypothetical protein
VSTRQPARSARPLITGLFSNVARLVHTMLNRGSHLFHDTEQQQQKEQQRQ